VVVTVSLPVLQGHIGPASLALGGPVNAEAARRLACDAEIIPVVLGACGGSTSGAPAAPCPGDSPRGDPAPCRLHLAGWRISMTGGIPQFHPPPGARQTSTPQSTRHRAGANPHPRVSVS
jgi:hypothetical protein